MRGRLVVGGGRSVTFPTLGKAEISLNIDPVANPDVLGDIASAPFKSASFDEVCFERVPFPSFTGPNIDAFSESARLLHWGGQLVLETGIAAPVDDIVARLRAMGFIGIDVHDLVYFVSQLCLEGHKSWCRPIVGVTMDTTLWASTVPSTVGHPPYRRNWSRE
jgi:hypothetical protein